MSALNVINAMMRIWPLKWREHQFTRVFVGLQRLCVALATAVDQVRAALFEPIHCKRWPRAITQQALEPGAVGGINAHPRIDRKTATVLAGSAALVHVFGVMRLQVAACHEGAKQALAHGGLHLGLHLSNCGHVDLDRVERDRLCVD